jgi:hypothetical protein
MQYLRHVASVYIDKIPKIVFSKIRILKYTLCNILDGSDGGV